MENTSANRIPMNRLFYGDNLDVLRKRIASNTVDLCYIDPPFNSQRTYSQIYNRIGEEDRAQAQSYIDTWKWDRLAIAGLAEIQANDQGRFTVQLGALLQGLHLCIGEGSLLAYLISISQRVTEIHRVLKDTGTFFFHCDPTASHYIKLLLDAIFVAHSGSFLNEIVWCYSQGGRPLKSFPNKHDIVFWYAKGKTWTFNAKEIRVKYELLSKKSSSSFTKTDAEGRKYKEIYGPGKKKLYKYYEDEGKIPYDWWTDIHQMTGRTAASGNEYLGYQTQKPEALLERMITAATKEGDLVLDAYCGCGTTVAVAQRLKRQWVGIDITYSAISVILRRLESRFGEQVLDQIRSDGIPQDMLSATALAERKDDRLRKEFEKWAVLTFTSNRAMISEKKGADSGIDGVAVFMTSRTKNARAIFQVKSGSVQRGDIAKLRGDMARDAAELAFFITLQPPSAPMVAEAKSAGLYYHAIMGREYERISIITIKQIVEERRRFDIPLGVEVLQSAEGVVDGEQFKLLNANEEDD